MPATEIQVVAPLTAIPGRGTLELGQHDLCKLTVGDVKNLIQERSRINGRPSRLPCEKQRLWWRGYVLDDDGLPMNRACVGVNAGERVQEDAESVVIFMTIEEQTEDDSSSRETGVMRSNSMRRVLRSNSFDIDYWRDELRQQGKIMKFCEIL